MILNISCFKLTCKLFVMFHFASRISFVNAFRFCLHFVHVVALSSLFAALNIPFLCRVCRLISQLIHFGPFGLMVTVSFGIAAFAGLITFLSIDKFVYSFIQIRC